MITAIWKWKEWFHFADLFTSTTLTYDMRPWKGCRRWICTEVKGLKLSCSGGDRIENSSSCMYHCDNYQRNADNWTCFQADQVNLIFFLMCPNVIACLFFATCRSNTPKSDTITSQSSCEVWHSSLTMAAWWALWQKKSLKWSPSQAGAGIALRQSFLSQQTCSVAGCITSPEVHF